HLAKGSSRLTVLHAIPHERQKYVASQSRCSSSLRSFLSFSTSLFSQHQTFSLSNLHIHYSLTQNVSRLQLHQTYTTNISSHVSRVFCLCLLLGIFLSLFLVHSCLLSVVS